MIRLETPKTQVRRQVQMIKEGGKKSVQVKRILDENEKTYKRAYEALMNNRPAAGDARIVAKKLNII